MNGRQYPKGEKPTPESDVDDLIAETQECIGELRQWLAHYPEHRREIVWRRSDIDAMRRDLDLLLVEIQNREAAASVVLPSELINKLLM